MTSFKFFNLPHEIAKNIANNYLIIDDLASLTLTCTTTNEIYRPDFLRALKLLRPKAVQLWHDVKRANYNEIRSIVTAEPYLMFIYIQHPKCRSEIISPLKQSFVDFDSPAWTIFKNSIKTNAQLECFSRQLSQPINHVDLESLFSAYKKYFKFHLLDYMSYKSYAHKKAFLKVNHSLMDEVAIIQHQDLPYGMLKFLICKKQNKHGTVDDVSQLNQNAKAVIAEWRKNKYRLIAGNISKNELQILRELLNNRIHEFKQLKHEFRQTPDNDDSPGCVMQ
jgi:hypothetical protein